MFDNCCKSRFCAVVRLCRGLNLQMHLLLPSKRTYNMGFKKSKVNFALACGEVQQPHYQMTKDKI